MWDKIEATAVLQSVYRPSPDNLGDRDFRRLSKAIMDPAGEDAPEDELFALVDGHRVVEFRIEGGIDKFYVRSALDIRAMDTADIVPAGLDKAIALAEAAVDALKRLRHDEPAA